MSPSEGIRRHTIDELDFRPRPSDSSDQAGGSWINPDLFDDEDIVQVERPLSEVHDGQESHYSSIPIPQCDGPQHQECGGACDADPGCEICKVTEGLTVERMIAKLEGRDIATTRSPS